MSLSSFNIECIGFNLEGTDTTNYTDATLSIVFRPVDAGVGFDSQNITFIYGDDPGANCLAAKGVGVTPYGGIIAAGAAVKAIAQAASTSGGVTTSGFPLYAKIGDTIYKSAAKTVSETAKEYPICLDANMVGTTFKMSPLS